jgi:hypothetical protein
MLLRSPKYSKHQEDVRDDLCIKNWILDENECFFRTFSTAEKLHALSSNSLELLPLSSFSVVEEKGFSAFIW